MIIRPAEGSDLDALARLHRATVTTAYRHIFPRDSTPPSVEELREQYRPLVGDADTTVLVADDDRVVGTIVVCPDDAVPAGWRIERFNVDPDRQGGGVGRRLYDRALESARQRSLERLNLWVLEDNTRARTIYQSWGWTLVDGWILPNDPPEILDVLYELALA